MSLAPGTQVGPYEILAFLGAGGMGEVYSARDQRLERSVAIKVLSASQDTDAARRERFVREARAIARLSHPHICTLYDVGQERLRPARGATPPSASERGWGPASTDDAGEVTFLVMELLEGETLADRLEHGALSLERALPIAVQVAEALAAAHKKGVIHRDLKPGNLMLTSTGVKLLDFGLAKLREAEDTEAIVGDTKTAWATDKHVAVGTLPYMAPEQIEGREIDARTDIFSFGVMMFEMIAGRRPFGGNTRASLMAAIVGAEPLSLAEVQPATPPALGRLIGRCLAKDPEMRWQTARDLATELRWFAETRPDKAAAAIPPAHWSRRAVIVGGLATLTVLVAAFAVIAGFVGQKQAPAAEYTQVTYRRGAVSSARFAPDGQTFVYSASWEGAPYRVFLGRPASPDARDLGLELGRILSISRASDMAVLFGPQSIVQTVGVRTLASVSMAGARRDLLDGVVDADWIPGTNNLAVIRDPGNGPWTVEFPAGTKVHEARAAWSLRVSPDGSRIAFLEGPSFFSGETDVNVVVIDRTGQKTVVSRNWAALGLAWAPSGREIWFTGTRFEKRSDGEDQSRLAPPSLRAVSLTGEERSIQHAPDWLVLHDIASDGRVLVSRNTIQIGLSCQAPGESQERDLSWQIASFATGLSADGQTVVFNDGLGGRTSSGNATVFSRNLDGSPAVRLGEGTGGRLSPDKKWVLTQQGDHLVLLPTGAGSPVSLPKGALGRVGMGAWLGDSKRIVFTGFLDNGPPRGYVQEIPDGAPRAITPPDVQLSGRAAVRDEHTILGTSNNQWMLYPLEGGDPRPLAAVTPPSAPIQWSDDGKFVYVLGGGGPIGPPGLEVFRVELATGQRSLWRTLVHPDPVGLERQRPSVMIAPDGRSYCYSYQRRLGNLFILEGLK